MLLDPSTFDLVQHIEMVLDAIQGDELAERLNAELMQSVLEIATPVCHTAGDVMRELADAARIRPRRGAGPGPPRRLGGHAPLQPLRAAADHGEGPLPRAHRPAPVRRTARADLRDAHPRRGRRSRQGDPGRERAPPAARAAARALRELALLARRADGARVEPADRLLRLPALGAAAAVPRLRRLRRRRRPARAHGLHRRLHAHLVGHPAPSEVGDDRGAHLRRRDAPRGRGRDRRVLPGARQAAQRALRRRRGDPHLPPHPHEREQVARRPVRARGARDGPGDRSPHPRPRSPSSSGARCASSSRTPASSARSASSRGSARCSSAATRPSASFASTTRTATSSRSCARSPMRPRRCPRTRPRPRARTYAYDVTGARSTSTRNVRVSMRASTPASGSVRVSIPAPLTDIRVASSPFCCGALPRQVDAARHPRARVQRVDEGVRVAAVVQRVGPRSVPAPHACQRDPAHPLVRLRPVDDRSGVEAARSRGSTERTTYRTPPWTPPGYWRT